MRTDVKIGIAVGLFVAIVAVAYFTLSGSQPPAEPPAEQPEGGTGGTAITPPGTGSGSRPGVVFRPVTPPPSPGPSTPTPPEPGTEDVEVTIAPRVTSPGPTVEPGPTIEPDPMIDPGPTIAPGPTVAPIPPETTKTYVVQEGDQGFWGIASKPDVYGDGQYWYLIAKANPGADSSHLKIGQRLTIPLKPAPETRLTRTTGGGLSTDASTGQKIYIVQEGDAGFWGIAQKPEVYGDGTQWPRIAKANPKADSSRLRAGQKLVIPPKPADASGGGTSGGAGAPALAPGQTIYVVQEGDAGFWDIAKKKYGDGTLWPAIAKANPRANPQRLRAGQKIVIPPVSTAREATAAAPTATTPRPSRPAGTDTTGKFPRPIFRNR